MTSSKAKKISLSQFLQKVDTEEPCEKTNTKITTQSKKKEEKLPSSNESKNFNSDWDKVESFDGLIRLNYNYFQSYHSCPIISNKMMELCSYGFFVSHVENSYHEYGTVVREPKVNPNTGRVFKRYLVDIEKRAYIGFYLGTYKDIALTNFVFNKLNSMDVVYTSFNLRTGVKVTNMRENERFIVVGRKRFYQNKRSSRGGRWEITRTFPQRIPVEEYPLMKFANVRPILKDTTCFGVTSLNSKELSFIDILLNFCRNELTRRYNF